MNFNKMSTREIVEYALKSEDNEIEVRKWMQKETRKQEMISKIALCISALAAVFAITALVMKLLTR